MLANQFSNCCEPHATRKTAGERIMYGFIASSAALFAMGVMGTPSLSTAQDPPPDSEPGLRQTALRVLSQPEGPALSVTSTSFANMGDIPFPNTQYRENRFPGLRWIGAPAGVKTYAVIMQDGDRLANGMPLLHWTMYDIPKTVHHLVAGLRNPPHGAHFGPNMKGANQPYLGPKTPPGPKHRYHFAVFALDTELNLPPTATYDDLVNAMKGHVLSAGEIVGLGMVDPRAHISSGTPNGR
jgi:para-nitrobenzyl esterase